MRTLRYFALIGLFSLGCGLERVWSQAANQHAPKLVCEQPNFNFGERQNTTEVEHIYILKNTGDLSAEIKQVRPSCGCTIASVSDRIVAPGGETKVQTKLSLQGRQGVQHKTIVIESNDPVNPSLTLTLEGTAVVEVKTEPSQLFFGRVKSDSVVTGYVDIVAQRPDAVFKVLRVETSTTNLVADAQPREDGKAYHVIIKTQGSLPQGVLRGNVRLVTDHLRMPAVDIPVFMFVSPPQQ